MPETIASKKRYAQSEIGRKNQCLASERQRVKAPLKITARSLARSLNTTAQCKCGQIAVEKHHHDYTKPLNVVHFCRACHRELHQSMV